MAIGHLEMESCPWDPLRVRDKRMVHQQRVEGSDGLPVVTTIGRCIAPTPPIQVQVLMRCSPRSAYPLLFWV